MKHAGEPVTRRVADAPLRRYHVFIRASGLPETSPVDEQLAALLRVIEPQAAQLAKLPADAQPDIVCAFSSGNGQGGFDLSPALIARLAALGLPVAVHLYPPTSD
jgi:hypothetical protein